VCAEFRFYLGMEDTYLPTLNLTSYQLSSGPGTQLYPWLLINRPRKSNPYEERVITECWLITEQDGLRIQKFWTSLSTTTYPLNPESLGLAGKLLPLKAKAHAESLFRNEDDTEPAVWKTADIEDSLIERVVRAEEDDRTDFDKKLIELFQFFRQNCPPDDFAALDVVHQLRLIYPESRVKKDQ
jgi:hypothetical protein